jgi:hypothetical protein
MIAIGILFTFRVVALVQQVFHKLLRFRVIASPEPEDGLFAQLNGRIPPGDLYHFPNRALIVCPAERKDDLLLDFLILLPVV